jgi:hypothetical protein
MSERKNTTQELEEVLQEVGLKIEELLKKGAEAGAELKTEIEKKVMDLRESKTSIEEELRKAKEILEKEYQDRKDHLEPRFEESKVLMKGGLNQIIEGIKILFGKNTPN